MERDNNDMNFDYGPIVARRDLMKRELKIMKPMFNKKPDDDRDGRDDDLALKAEAEQYIKFGYCGAGFSYFLMYCLFTVGHGSRPKFTTVVDIWSILIMVVFCITSCMLFTSVGVSKVVLNTMLALLLASAIGLFMFAVVNPMS